MRLWIISYGTPSERYPQHGIFQFEQAKALSREITGQVYFLEVDLRSFRRIRKWGLRFHIVEGIQVCNVSIPCGPLPERMLNEIGAFALKWLYRKTLRMFGPPDIVHAHFTSQAYMAAKTMDATTPLVVTEHSSGIMKSPVGLETMRIARIAYRRANKLIAVSSQLGCRIKTLFGYDSSCIPNTFDNSLFKYSGGAKQRDPFRIVSVGNLNSGKRMDIAILAFESFHQAFPDSEMIICGDGPEREPLNNLIAERSLKNSVTLLGACPPKQVAKVLSESNLFVLASKSETFGVVFIEALASGLPLIGTRCGGPEDIINEGNGVLVDVDDFHALSEAMIHIASNPEHYKGAELSREAISKYSPHRVALRILKVYEELGVR